MRNWLIASILAAGMIAGPAFAGDDHRGWHPARGYYDHPKHYRYQHDYHPGYHGYRGGPRIEHHYYGAPRYYYVPGVRYSEPYYYPRHGGGELELSYRIFLK